MRRRGFDTPVFVHNFQQRQDSFLRMLKLPSGEDINLIFDARTSLSHDPRRFYTGVRKLFSVEVSDLVVPAPRVNTRPTFVISFSTHRDANLLKDSSTISHFVSPRRIPPSARLFNTGRPYCNEGLSGTRSAGLVEKSSTYLIRKPID